jgi:replicative DNA helicase
MLQALETLGYSEDDINKYVRVRFGWSAENMPTLIQDLKEFAPEVVVIDSLSTANRFSVYRESEMEYARPILEMTGLANQYKTTFVIIHHVSKEGVVRGTTAIRNAVSEVWQLTKDNSQTATVYDRVLEINKSRSRSSGKKYRLMFSPEDLSFTFLGEEGDDLGGPGQSAKEKTLQLLADHRNIKFTSEEIAHRLGISRDYARRYLNDLSADGLVSVKRQPGKANAYFLAYEGSPKDHPSDHLNSSFGILGNPTFQPTSELGIKSLGSPQDHPKDHPINLDTASIAAKGDPETGENCQKTQHEEIFEMPTHPKDHLSLELFPSNDCGGDPGGDPTLDMCENIQALQNQPQALLGNQPSDSEQGDPGGDPQSDPSPVEKINFELDKVYWFKPLGKRCKTVKLFKTIPEADIIIAGEIEKIRVNLSELSLIPSTELRTGDEVEVLTGELKGQVLTVSSIDPSSGIWLRKNTKQSVRPYGPFDSTQLRKKMSDIIIQEFASRKHDKVDRYRPRGYRNEDSTPIKRLGALGSSQPFLPTLVTQDFPAAAFETSATHPKHEY